MAITTAETLGVGIDKYRQALAALGIVADASVRAQRQIGRTRNNLTVDTVALPALPVTTEAVLSPLYYKIRAEYQRAPDDESDWTSIIRGSVPECIVVASYFGWRKGDTAFPYGIPSGAKEDEWFVRGAKQEYLAQPPDAVIAPHTAALQGIRATILGVA